MFKIKSTNHTSQNGTVETLSSSARVPDAYGGDANAQQAPPPRVELLLVCFSCEASDSVPFASSLGVSFATYIFKVDTVPFVLACPREDPALKVPNAQMGSLTKTYFKVSNL